MKKWLDEWVFGPKDWEDFIVKLGAKNVAGSQGRQRNGLQHPDDERQETRSQDENASVRRKKRFLGEGDRYEQINGRIDGIG